VSLVRAWFARKSMSFWIRALKTLLRDHRVEAGEIRRHLRRGDIACDIGANKGGFIYWMSRWVGDGRVVAFEPQAELARDLKEICGVIGLGNVTVEAKAVHIQSGEQALHVPVGHAPGASLVSKTFETDDVVRVMVPIVALDDYFDDDDRVTLLKIDVEGAELGVLQGAERILRRHGPLLAVECENRHLPSGSVEVVFSYLAGLGYEGSFVCRRRLLPISQFNAAVHQRRDGPWFWKRKDYCNNFVFRKARDTAARRPLADEMRAAEQK
jgi:FkbM family methyltransferase